MAAWLSKWGPLAGVLSAVLVVISFVSGNSTPDDNATGPHVIQWYTTHHNQRILSDLLVGLAMFFLVVFAATLARHVRRGDRWIATGALGGAVATAIGFTCLLGFDLVLATRHQGPDARLGADAEPAGERLLPACRARLRDCSASSAAWPW